MPADPRSPASSRPPRRARSAGVALCAAVLVAGGIFAALVLRGSGRDALSRGSPGGGRLASPSPVQTGSAWGAFATTAAPGSIDTLEKRMGGPFGSFGDYVKLSGAGHFPDPTALRARSEGALLYLNINAFAPGAGRSKVCYPWSGIAGGRFDGLLRGWAKALVAFDDPSMVVSFDHEPSVDRPNQPSCGTASEYVGAYERVVRVFREGGVTAPFVWTMTSSTFLRDRARSFQPPGDFFQIVGVDGYNLGANQRKRWKTPARVFADAHVYAQRLGKPLLVGETGCVPDDPRSPGWVKGAAGLFRSWDDVVAVEWNLRRLFSPLSSPTTLTAWLAAAARASS